jgi:hypothetical protein
MDLFSYTVFIDILRRLEMAATFRYLLPYNCVKNLGSATHLALQAMETFEEIKLTLHELKVERSRLLLAKRGFCDRGPCIPSEVFEKIIAHQIFDTSLLETGTWCCMDAGDRHFVDWINRVIIEMIDFVDDWGSDIQDISDARTIRHYRFSAAKRGCGFHFKPLFMTCYYGAPRYTELFPWTPRW